MRSSIALAKQIMDQAPDQAAPKKIRLVKTALAASEHLGRCLERAAKSEAARNIARVDEFHHAIIDEIMKGQSRGHPARSRPAE